MIEAGKTYADRDFSGQDLTANKDLTGIKFSGCNLSDANFSGVNLSNAVFQNCDLTGADLSSSVCTNTFFDEGCKLKNVNWTNANTKDTFLDNKWLDKKTLKQMEVNVDKKSKHYEGMTRAELIVLAKKKQEEIGGRTSWINEAKKMELIAFLYRGELDEGESFQMIELPNGMPLDEQFITDLANAIHEKNKDKPGGEGTQQQLEELKKKLEETGSAVKHEIVIKKHRSKEIPVEAGIQHYVFPLVLILAECRIPTFLVGPPGGGKTHAAESVANCFELKFYTKPVCIQTTESSLLGYMDAGGTYRDTLFRRAYEHGGVYLMDEIDAGSPQVLLALNAALANKQCGFPDGMIRQHKDFIFIGGANTIGQGASREFVGRNQLDAATLDRFAYVQFPIDEGLEARLVGAEGRGHAPIQPLYERKKKVDIAEWVNFVQKVRVVKKEQRVIISPRASLYGRDLLERGVKWEFVEQVLIWDKMPDAISKKIKKDLADATKDSGDK